jgi:hypothetical protein
MGPYCFSIPTEALSSLVTTVSDFWSALNASVSAMTPAKASVGVGSEGSPPIDDWADGSPGMMSAFWMR